MTGLAHELRIALRTLARARGFTATVIATLAIAIALQTSVLAFVNAYLVRELPFPASERLYSVAYSRPGESTPRGLEQVNWDALGGVLEERIAWDLDVFYLRGGEYTQSARGAWVTPGFMNGFGIRPLVGRGFTPDEFQPGGPQVALISHTLWQTLFRGDSGIVGRAFDAYVSDRPEDPERFTIVGVLAANFWHLNPYTDILTPLRGESYPYIVRLSDGVPLAMAARRITQAVRSSGVTLAADVELESLHARYAGRVRPLLLAITAAVSVVLLIACANVAFLVLIRGLRRQREAAVRIAIGGGGWQVARTLVLEALILALAASGIGIVIAALLTSQFAGNVMTLLGRSAPGGAAAVSIDGTVALSVAALAVVVAVVLSLVPYFGTSRRALYSVLRRGRQGGADGAVARRLRSSLIVIEVAGSLALLSACGLMVRTVVRMLDVELGLQTHGVLSAGLAIREQTHPDAQARAAFYERLTAALEDRAGLRALAFSYPPPLAELPPRRVRAEGASATHEAGVVTISSAYFDLLGIPLRQGRQFTRSDRPESEPVAIVSATAARRMWPDANAIGQRVVLTTQGMNGDSSVVRTVVGVVGDVRHAPTDDQAADVYIPLLQAPGRFTRVLLRADGPPSHWLGEVRGALAPVDATASLEPLRPLQTALDEQLARPRFLAAMLTSFGIFATLLAMMGLYGVIAYSVRQREQEIAVRMAVGANGGAIMRLFLREGAVLLPAGLLLGAIAAAGMGRLLQAQLYGVQTLDVLTLALATVVLGGAACAAVWWPARRASRTDPLVALRHE